LAADQFIVARGQEKTVIAGYHWFSDWGRDTMIALPGLTLATGRTTSRAASCLPLPGLLIRACFQTASRRRRSTEYNTVDATLWYFEAVRRWLATTGSHEFVRANLYEILTDIIDWHVRGTRYNIQVDDDGLLGSGAPGVQLTWMDAKVGDWVVTPRAGKPVEIQRSGINALSFMTELARSMGDRARSLSVFADGEEGEGLLRRSILERGRRLSVRRGRGKPSRWEHSSKSDLRG
jgi:predicted glycogen debranching enzyme